MEKKNFESVIGACPIFAGLNRKYLELITGCVSNVRFDRDQFIFREGESANHFYLIREGLVALEIEAPGRRSVNIETIGSNDVLGWSWLFPPYKWHFDAKAVEPVRALAFDGKCLRRKSEEDPELGYELMKRFAQIMMERLQATRLQVMDVYGAPS